MVNDLEALRNEEKELLKVIASKVNPTIQEKKAFHDQLSSLRARIANISAFENLEVGRYVNKKNSPKLGQITGKSLEKQPILFVSWSKSISIPEQPRLLELDEIANSGIIKVGDIVRVANKESGVVTGYRLEKIIEIEARGWIEVSDNEIVSPDHWKLIEEAFDLYDFNWIVGDSDSDTDAKTWINIKSAIARVNLSTARLALQWIDQYSCEGYKDRVEALEKRIRRLEETKASIPPLEYLQQLSVKVYPPIAAMKVDKAAVEKLLEMAVAAVTAKELEVAECIIADAQKFANSKRLVLKVNMDGWLITPLCKTSVEALALCPAQGDRVMGIGQHVGGFGGTVEGLACELDQVQATVKWDDGTLTTENGFTLEILPPILEYLSKIENTDDMELEPVETKQACSTEVIVNKENQPPLALGFQEISVSQLRSHPVNSKIYGEQEDDSSLDEMIQTSGWIKTLLVTPDREVIGGNRRLRIAKKQGKETVNIEVREFANDEAVLVGLLLDNAAREKTVEQKVREARFWLPIESEKAKHRKGRSEENQESFPGGDKGQVRDIISKRVGLGSGKNFQKADKVLSVIESLKESDSVVSESLRELLNNKSIHAAYQLVCESEERLKWQPKVGDRVKVSLKAERHADASGTIIDVSKGAFVDVRFDPASEGMNEDVVHVSLVLPVDIAKSKAHKKEAEALAKPETRFGLKEQPDGGLLPEKERNEGFDPNAIPTNVSNNVINLPLQSESGAGELEASKPSTKVADEIAMGIRYLSPRELADALNWAAEDNTNPLSDAHLDALMKVITKIWSKRHPPELEAAS